MLGHGGSSAGSYLADPTFPIPSHCAVIILFQSVPVHQLSRLALYELRDDLSSGVLFGGGGGGGVLSIAFYDDHFSLS